MLRLSRLAWCVAVLAVAAAALPGQGQGEPARRPTFARVEDGRGEPLANAVVTFAGCLPHLGVEAGPRDLLQVQTDARGRAQAKLLPELCYVAWAIGPADAQGKAMVTEAHGWFGAGSLFTLRGGEAVAPRTLPVEGLAAWQGKGPLRFAAWTSMPGSETPLPLSPDGVLTLPPGPYQVIEVATADGLPLLHVDAGADRLVVPPPQIVKVRAKDENGAPLAGARVRLRVGRWQPWRQDSLGSVVEDRWRPLGVTDADGLCVVDVPYAADPLRDPGHGDLLLFVGAPGRPSVAGGPFGNELFQDDRKAQPRPVGELTFTCKRVTPLTGSVGKVPAGTLVHLSAVCKMFVERTSYRHDARAFHAEVAADGTFTFDDVPPELHSSRFSIVSPSSPAAVWPVFPSLRGRELPPEVMVSEPALRTGEGQVDLSLQVLEPTGGPARGLIAYLAPAATNGVLVRDATVRFPLDARGSAQLRLVPGPWVVMAWTDGGWAARVLQLQAGSATESLTMHEHQRMRLQLRDAQGQPIAGARIVVRGTTTRGTSDALQSILQSLRSQWATQWEVLRTDQDGRVVVPFIPVEGVTQKLGLAWQGGATADFVLAASSDWVTQQPR